VLDCVSVSNMRESDAWTIQNRVPSLELMRRAAYGVYLAADWQGNIAIVVGSGNNGGDGFALACVLQESGIISRIFTVSTHFSPDSAYYAEKAKSLGISIEPFCSGCLQGCDTVVDCLLGTGFQGDMRENYRLAIEAINACGAFVISVDINSGMNGDSDRAELAVYSDLTVSIGAVKRGQIGKEAGRYMKRLICVDIGIVFQQQEGQICSLQELEQPSEEGVARYVCPPWLDMERIQTY